MLPKRIYFIIVLSLAVILNYLVFAHAQTTIFDLGQVVVSEDEDSRDNLTIEEKTKISQKTLKSHKVVDLAEILADEMIEASMVRKSGYGNEVGLRGFTKSNLRFTQDDTLLEGSCGSRKDPPLSHINLLTIQKIEVKEGPYDVSVPGALGGSINVISKDPQSGLHGEILSKFGSYGYLSQGGIISGGSEKLQGLFGYNYSKSGQYEDGAGNKVSSFNPNYNNDGRNLDAFKKHDFWGKALIEPADNQKVSVSSSYGEAHDILTPRVAMDTEKEKTYLNKIEYTIDNLSSISKELSISGYYNRIEHYPYGEYRALPVGIDQKRIEAISYVSGAQVENKIEAGLGLLTYGTDLYFRNWYGNIINRNTGVILNNELFPDVNELNSGLYIKAERDIGKLSATAGLRMDVFYSKANENLKFSKAMTGNNGQTDVLPSADAYLKYFLTDVMNIFGGLGLTNRMPTTVERYVQESAGYYGNPDLKPSRNFETDLGFETKFAERLKLKVKGFYSYLTDYIYQKFSGGIRTYTNIDAYISGGDATAAYDLSQGFTAEAGLAYQRGRKLSQPAGNNDKDLAEISPLKIKLALAYDKNGFFAVYEWLHSLDSKDIDAAAGETTLKGWDVFNFRAGYQFAQNEGNFPLLNGLSLNFGIDNLFDRKYAVANSYEYDPTDPGGANVRIVNEPGRFIYGSISYKF
ncbi:MAG: TonB-dependent receptor [Candidatus Omnitrophica bacterium]|nr:TonB-dependent receptor [Candidatus Omnitrophota bacterium]